MSKSLSCSELGSDRLNAQSETLLCPTTLNSNISCEGLFFLNKNNIWHNGLTNIRKHSCKVSFIFPYFIHIFTIKLFVKLLIFMVPPVWIVFMSKWKMYWRGGGGSICWYLVQRHTFNKMSLHCQDSACTAKINFSRDHENNAVYGIKHNIRVLAGPSLVAGSM